MSILLEALEKAGQEKKYDFRPIAETPKKPVVETLARAPVETKRKTRYFAAAVLSAIVAIGIIAMVRWANRGPDIIDTSVRLPDRAAVPARRRVVVAAPVERPSAINVTGIMWDAANPIALINERFFWEGDEVLGVRIIEISKTGVRFLGEDGEFTVSMK